MESRALGEPRIGVPDGRIEPATAAGRRFTRPADPSDIAFLIWALGCAAALTSLAVGSLRFRKLVREAAPVRDLVWKQQTA